MTSESHGTIPLDNANISGTISDLDHYTNINYPPLTNQNPLDSITTQMSMPIPTNLASSNPLGSGSNQEIPPSLHTYEPQVEIPLHYSLPNNMLQDGTLPRLTNYPQPDSIQYGSYYPEYKLPQRSVPSVGSEFNKVDYSKVQGYGRNFNERPIIFNTPVYQTSAVPQVIRNLPQEPLESVPNMVFPSVPTNIELLQQHDQANMKPINGSTDFTRTGSLPSLNTQIPVGFSARLDSFPSVLDLSIEQSKRKKRSSTNSYDMTPETAARNRCQICNKQFKRPSSLQTHLYSHTGEKLFKCPWPDCGRHFSVKSNMTRHAKLHERDYKKQEQEGSSKQAF